MEKLLLAMAEFFECQHEWVLSENRQRELSGSQEYEKAAIERDKCYQLYEKMKELRKVISELRSAVPND